MFQIKYKSARRYQGKRARRAAFYHHQRVQNLFQRVVLSKFVAHRKKFEGAYRNMLVTGVGWVKLSPEEVKLD